MVEYFDVNLDLVESKYRNKKIKKFNICTDKDYGGVIRTLSW